MKILFRCDAGPIRGSGHLMRCLSLAAALRNAGHDCTFVCREDAGGLLNNIRAAGHSLFTLPAGSEPVVTEEIWDEGRQWDDFELTQSAIGNIRYEWLIIDHYGLDQRWEETGHQIADQIMVIDDLANRPHNCDALLDQNEYLDKELRYSDLIPGKTKCLLGGDYALLRDEFGQARPETGSARPEVRNVLIMMGGADHKGVTMRLLRILAPSLQSMGITADVIVGTLNPHFEGITGIAREYTGINVHASPPRISDLLLKADIAFGAGGTATWEFCCLGVPLLMLTFAENQVLIAESGESLGFARYIGRQDQVSDSVIEDAFKDLVHDIKSRQSMARIGSDLVDGQGVNRICNYLEQNRK